MEKYILIVVLGISLSSCGRMSPEKVANKLCNIFDKIHTASTLKEMKKIQSEVESLAKAAKKINEDEIMAALEKKCPETAKLLKDQMNK